MEAPGSLPFHNARIQSDRKVSDAARTIILYNDTRRLHDYTPVSCQHNATRAQAKKRAGVITSSVKNRPPSMLTAV